MLLTNVQCHRYLYPYHDIDNTGTYNRKHTWNYTVSNHPIHQHGHTNFWYVCLLEEYILISKNAAIMCGMYIINGVHGPEPRSSEGNTSSNPIMYWCTFVFSVIKTFWVWVWVSHYNALLNTLWSIYILLPTSIPNLLCPVMPLPIDSLAYEVSHVTKDQQTSPRLLLFHTLIRLTSGLLSHQSFQTCFQNDTAPPNNAPFVLECFTILENLTANISPVLSWIIR